MKRREYLFGFVLVLVGLSIGFAISAPPTGTPYHTLDKLFTQEGGLGKPLDDTTPGSAATGNPNLVMDQADNAGTVTSIGPNIVGGYGLHNLLAPYPPQPAYNIWTLIPLAQVPNVPANANWLIFEYDIHTGTVCKSASLEFTDDPTVHPYAGTVVHVSIYDLGDPAGRHDQVWVPVAKHNPGKTWMKYYDANNGVGGCGYAVYMVAYVV